MGSKAPISTKHLDRAQQTPLQHRRAGFDFSDVPRYWLGGDPFMTRLIDALSMPHGKKS